MAMNHGSNAATDTESRSNSAAATASQDPFAAQRTADNNPFAEQDEQDARRGSSDVAGSPTSPQDGGMSQMKRDRRESKEWGMNYRLSLPSLFSPRYAFPLLPGAPYPLSLKPSPEAMIMLELYLHINNLDWTPLRTLLRSRNDAFTCTADQEENLC